MAFENQLYLTTLSDFEQNMHLLSSGIDLVQNSKAYIN